MNALQEKVMERYKWQKEFEERYHNRDRLINLWNNFYLAHEVELNYSTWHINFHQKVGERIETI